MSKMITRRTFITGALNVSAIASFDKVAKKTSMEERVVTSDFCVLAQNQECRGVYDPLQCVKMCSKTRDAHVYCNYDLRPLQGDNE